jgi:hypothetical protein
MIQSDDALLTRLVALRSRICPVLDRQCRFCRLRALRKQRQSFGSKIAFSRDMSPRLRLAESRGGHLELFEPPVIL